MRSLLYVGAALAAPLASADEPASSAGEKAAACDFFQSELTDVTCGNTASFSLSGDGNGLTVVRTTMTQPGNVRGPGGASVQHYDYLDAYEGATLVAAPWQGVRLQASGEIFQYDNVYSEQFTPLGGLDGPSTRTANQLGGAPGWESIGAEATIWDRQTDSSRYVLSVAGSLELFPGGPNLARDLQQIGLEAGARWRLGGSGLSLDYSSTSYLQRFDNPGEYLIASEARLLLANDDYGVAAGPILLGTNVLSHAARFNTGWSEAWLGGEAVVAPFRTTKLPVLRDMTIDMSATHSIGQAALVPGWAGSASAFDYTAVARFNFYY
jgi:hypothetical protein